MEKKYIVELGDENVRSADGYDWLQLLISVAYKPVMIETPIQLLPYTEPDTEKVRKESCDECMNEVEDLAYQLYSSKVDEAYQRGLKDMYEKINKVLEMPLEDKRICFGETYTNKVIKRYNATTFVSLLNAYEQKKQEEQITIGDEVVFYNGERCVVTVIEDGQVTEVMDENGFSMKMDDGLRNSMKKTGRHFEELVLILKKMKGE